MTDACQYLHDTLSRLPRLRRETWRKCPVTASMSSLRRAKRDTA
jgi:hypothetical protein